MRPAPSAVDMESLAGRRRLRRCTAAVHRRACDRGYRRRCAAARGACREPTAGQLRLWRLDRRTRWWRPPISHRCLRLARRYRAASRSLAAVAAAGSLTPRRSRRWTVLVAGPLCMKALVTGATGFRRRGGRAGAAARRLAGAGAGARAAPIAATCRILPVEDGRRVISPIAASLERALGRLCRVVSRRGGLSAWGRASHSSCIAPMSRAPATFYYAARQAGRRTDRLHQQRRHHGHTRRRLAGR